MDENLPDTNVGNIEYIRKADAKDALQEKVFHNLTDEFYGAMQAIDEMPSADVVPVVHGKWMKEDRGHVEYCAVCDQCGFDWMWSDRGYFKFCPNCGAKMDGKRKE